MEPGLIEKKQKKRYHDRRQRIAETLQGFGLSLGRSKRIVYRYPLNLLEKLIEETIIRHPVAPDEYFLKGLQRSRIQYGDYRKRDRKKKKKRVLLVSEEMAEDGEQMRASGEEHVKEMKATIRR